MYIMRWNTLFFAFVAALCCTAPAHADAMSLGRMGAIQVDNRLNVSVRVTIPSGRSDDVARNFLANPANASRWTRGSTMTIPFEELSDPYKAICVLRLFPNDTWSARGVEHVVTRDEETLQNLSEIFTGTTRNSRSIGVAGTVGEVSVTRNSHIIVTIPREGVDLEALGRAVLKQPGTINSKVRGNNIVIDATDMRDVYRGAVLNHLFPFDTIREDARRHQVKLSVESLFRISLWFTGDGGNWQAIKRASHKRSDQLGRRETIIIPRSLLGEWASMTEDDISAETATYPLALTSRSRRGEISTGQRLFIPASIAAGWTRLLENGEDGAQDAAGWFVYRSMTNGPLTYEADDQGGYALYRLQRGEALYSSVIVRFTGVDSAQSVMAQARLVLRRSGYTDARRLPVNARIKIPMNLLDTQWRPEGDPARLAEAQEERVVAQVTREINQELAQSRREERARPASRALEGVTVIIDAGHGGRDPGALGSSGLTENEVCYDIFVRIKRELERRTRATVLATNEDQQTHYAPSDASTIRDNNNECLLTTPQFCNTNTVTSANLRFYLANAYVRQALAQGKDLDNVVFASIHADALHTSVRGATVYIPSARYSAGRYNARSAYRRYTEVAQRPTVSLSNDERSRSQALSQRFAENFMSQLRSGRIAVHESRPIRSYIVRAAGRSPFVPAVIRYNKAPTKVLIEIGNIKNTHDAANMRSASWRERFATAFVDALIENFR